MILKRYYSETQAEEISSETCHPNYLKLFTAPFYYALTDPISPFGNDYGSDHLFYLEEWYRESEETRNLLPWMFKIINEYGFKFAAEACAKILDEAILLEIEETDPPLLEAMDQTIIATCLGQIKITGKVDAIILDFAFLAIDRQKLLKVLEPDWQTYLDTLKMDLVQMHQRYIHAA